ncbi:hypothetical protein KBX06_05425 [Micromonospora sp. C31]|uniref:hypothetical protein n=1 Tax=Micromonospora sp. C31 TaxID=2824876 RepID=UPI001B38042A|nr:hypothetical protein [Micromonospora sp. C31]MBQ1072610.1 hypothetical protein [Micromonospora sp. C31]
MTRPATALPAALALILLAPLAGCAGRESGSTGSGGTKPPATARPATAHPDDADPTGTPSASPVAPADRPTRPSGTALPTLRPPKEPTDTRPTGVITARVTRGGDGPCYGMVTLDGIEYAVYGPGLGVLTEGQLLTLRVTAHTVRMDCGPGTPVAASRP